MRFFVTGGTGFIGSHFLRVALAAGHEVVALRRSESLTRIHLPKQPVWVEGDMDDDWTAWLRGCDALMHFAAAGVSPQPADWRLSFFCNVYQSMALMEMAVRCRVGKIIVCGSCVEYGKSAERYEAVPADAALEPIGPYAGSKAAFSLALESMARTATDTSFSILRPFHIYGEGQHEANFWPSLCQAAAAGYDFPMTVGDQIRDFMDVSEVAYEFLAHAVKTSSAGRFEVKNLGSGRPQKLKDFATHWWGRLSTGGTLRLGAIPYRENEIMRYVPRI